MTRQYEHSSHIQPETLPVPVYMPAKSDVLSLVHEVAEKYHGDLHDHGVTYSVLMVHPTEKDTSGEPVLKLHGDLAAATIKPTKLKGRIKGAADADIEIDWITWKGLNQAERVALLDHELEHLELAKDDEGNAELDDAMRPKLKSRPHDLILGGFRSVIERHKGAALEFQIIRSIGDEYRQAIFAFTDDMAPQDSMPHIDLSEAG